MGVFAAIALVISILGLVAMSTYFVQMRSLEIAVRKVLGASSENVMRKVVVPFMLYILIAFVIAVPIIYYLMNEWLSSYNYRITLWWWIYAVAGAICMAVSFMAIYFQCRNAANANPVNSLYQNQ